MSKICLTCKKVDNLKNNVTYKIIKKEQNWRIKAGLKSIFPNNNIPNLKTIKEKKPANYDQTNTLQLGKTHKNKYMLYFASNLNSNCNTIHSAEKSYKNTSNIGISKLDKNGDGKIYLRCPNIYYENGKTYYPHYHFILTNNENTKWIYKLYAKVIICKVSKKYVKSAIKSNCTMIINALSSQYYIKQRIPNSISLPSSTINEIDDNDIINYIKSMKSNYNIKIKNIFDIPIITYCYDNTCDASNLLVERLLKIGFKNIKEYSDGIMGWKNKNKVYY